MCVISLKKKTNKLQNQKDKMKVASETQTLGHVHHEKHTQTHDQTEPQN
jgi:hypothetical protein